MPFVTRFTPGGRALWVAEDGEKLTGAVDEALARSCRALAPQHRLPTVGIHDAGRHQLFLIDVARLGVQMDRRRRDALMAAFGACGFDVVLVTAFACRREFQQLAIDNLWGTLAWFADEPDHIVHFDRTPSLGRVRNVPK